MGTLLRKTCLLRSTHEHMFIVSSKQISNGKLPANTEIKECLKVLQLSEQCRSLTELRDSFVRLAKMYHPDGKTETSDAAKFAQIEHAYRTLRAFMSHDNCDNAGTATFDADDIHDTQEKDYGIKHTAPQHRQYLSNEGMGSGTVFQRQRQYQAYRVDRAVDSVRERRTTKMAAAYEDSLVFKDKMQAQKHKIRNAIDRLVEDLIQESMAKGDFDNLAGKGKPLKHSAHNPYIDSVTQKLNEVLINNGFIPEWIQLDKDIREDISGLRSRLTSMRQSFGPCPFSGAETSDWLRTTSTLDDAVADLNRKIDKYNLLVPTLEKQRVHFRLDVEAQKALAKTSTESNVNVSRRHGHDDCPLSHQKPSNKLGTNDGGLLGLFSYLFRP